MSLDQTREFIRCVQAAQKAVDTLTISRHVDVWLSQDEYDAMTMMCAYATACAKKAEAHNLVRSFIIATNQLHKGNSNWTPLEVPEPQHDKK